MGNCCNKPEREEAYRVENNEKPAAGKGPAGKGPAKPASKGGKPESAKKKGRQAVQGIVDDDVEIPSIPKDEATKSIILRAMSKNLLFTVLDDAARAAIMDTMSSQEVKPGELVILQGDQKADKFYVVESGLCEVYLSKDVASVTPTNLGDKLPLTYGPATAFGELGLLYSSPRAASIKCVEPSKLWVMDRTFYLLLKRRFNEKNNKEKLELLDAVPSFKTLNPRQMDLLVDALETVEYEAGHKIITKGDVGDRFYVLKSGEVVVQIDGEEVPTGRLYAGSFFGERALIKDDVRAADVFAVTAVTCMYLNRQAFTDILGPLENLWKVEELRRVPILSNLKEQQLGLLAQELGEIEIPKGEFVFHKNDKGDTLFVVAEGSLSVVDEEKMVVLAKLEKGAYFGERALLGSENRTASIRTDCACKLACLDRQVLERCLGSLQQLLMNWRADTLSQVDTLKRLTPADRYKLAKELTAKQYKDGQLIVTRGESGDCFYIIESGEAAILGNDGLSQVAYKKQGSYFGERALITNEVRSASVQALGPVQVLVVSRTAFHGVFGSDTQLLNENAASYTVDTSELKVTLEDLTPLSVLGIGAFGKVTLVKHASALYALKAMSKKQIIEKNMINHVRREKSVMKTLSSPFTVSLVSTFQDEANLYMMMEKVMGGELFLYLQSRDDPLNEDETRFYAGCVTFALDYMHSHGYMYRDLKPENLLIDGNGYLKVTDYGFAKKLLQGKSYTICGTPEYLAPEIVNQHGHTHSVDWWALGVLIFEMLTQETPFGANDQMEILNNISTMNIQWEYARGLSQKCRDLVKKFLSKSPAKRLGSLKGGTNDIKQHPWFAGFQWEDLSKRTIKAFYVPQLAGPDDTRHFEDIPMDTKVPGQEDGHVRLPKKVAMSAFAGW